MKNDKSKSRCDRVFTGADWVLEADRISRIIGLLPEGGELSIGKGIGGWKIMCRIEEGQILKAETLDPGRNLEYIESLLERLKRLEGMKGNEASDTRRDQPSGTGSIPAQDKDRRSSKVLQAKTEGGCTKTADGHESAGKVSACHQNGISRPEWDH